MEFGELIVNIPTNQAPFLKSVIVPAIGIVFLLFLGKGLIERRNIFSGIDCYVISYLCILFLWPYWDTRFILPIIPFLLATFIWEIKTKYNLKIIRTLCLYFVIYFVLIGYAALGYSTRISLAGNKFPDYFGAGTFKKEYQAILQSKNFPIGTKMSSDALNVLKLFGK